MPNHLRSCNDNRRCVERFAYFTYVHNISYMSVQYFEFIRIFYYEMRHKIYVFFKSKMDQLIWTGFQHVQHPQSRHRATGYCTLRRAVAISQNIGTIALHGWSVATGSHRHLFSRLRFLFSLILPEFPSFSCLSLLSLLSFTLLTLVLSSCSSE